MRERITIAESAHFSTPAISMFSMIFGPTLRRSASLRRPHDYRRDLFDVFAISDADLGHREAKSRLMLVTVVIRLFGM